MSGKSNYSKLNLTIIVLNTRSSNLFKKKTKNFDYQTKYITTILD